MRLPVISGVIERRILLNYRVDAEVLGRLVPRPFRPQAVAPDVLAWNGHTIARMAGTIDAEQRYDDLPILADALEEAGCTDPDILRHCRGDSGHVRGCWAVDLILAKDR